MNDNKKELFEYYYVYGEVEKLPVAIIHKKNVKSRKHALELATEILTPRGISNVSIVEMSEDPTMSNIGGSTVNFLYYDTSFVDVKLVNENTPALIVYKDTSTRQQGVGYAFMDDKIMDDFVRKVLEVYMLQKKRIKVGE